MKKMVGAIKRGVVVVLTGLTGLILVFVAAGLSAQSSDKSFAKIETENGVLDGSVIKTNNPNASADAYIEFSGQSTVMRRFPGDPNPRVTGKAYWGSSIGGNGDPGPRHETPTGKSLSVRRTFFSWNHINTGSIVSTARTDHQNNRLPIVSFKTPRWSEFAPGDTRHNATLDKVLSELDALGKPVWLVAYHEPENDPDDGTPAQWRDMQRRVRERMNALGTRNIAFMAVLMDWTWNPQSGRNPNDWWVDGIWDAMLLDPYQENVDRTILDNVGLKNAIPWLENKGIPFGTAEWAMRTVTGGNFIGKSDSQYAADSSFTAYCNAVESGQLLKSTTAAQENSAKARMQSVWEYGFANNKDWIAHTYFDTCINSANGPWRLGAGQLEKFQEILRNDTRVQRINEL